MIFSQNCLIFCGVMVGMLTSSAVDCGFDLRFCIRNICLTRPTILTPDN